MKKLYPLIILLVFVFAVQCYGEASTADPDNIWTREKLTGDWWGIRTDLAEHGITLDRRLVVYYQGVTSGGANTNSEPGGKLDWLLNIDGHKLGLWEGFSVSMRVETQFGNSINADAGALALPNTSMLYPRPGEEDTAITGLTFTQALSKNFALTAGKMNIVDLWSMIYPHTGGGTEGFMNANMLGLLGSGLPWLRWVNLSVMGAGGLVLTDDGQVQGGVLVFDTQNCSTTTGFEDLFEDGVAVLGLWRFFFDVGGKPGSLMVSGGGSSRDYASLDRSDWGFVPPTGLTVKTKNAWSVGVNYDQVLWQAPDNDEKNLRLFTGFSISDGNPSFGKWGCFGSVEGWGLVPNREKDRMGAGAFFNQLSSDLKSLSSGVGVDFRNTWGVELYYNAEVTQWFHVSPNLQLVSNQNESDSTAVILGVRGVIDF